MSTVQSRAMGQVRRQRGGMSWRLELDLLVRTYMDTKTDGRALSNRTRHEHREVLFAMFELLRGNGFKLRPANIGRKHLDWLVAHYGARLAAGSIAASTLHTYFSVLRRFCDATGHVGMVQPVDRLFACLSTDGHDVSRHNAARRDKSWAAAGVDFEQVVHEAARIEPFVAMALLAQSALGLRRREALCLEPTAGAADQGWVDVVRGAKGGRHRQMVLQTEDARLVVRALAAWIDSRPASQGRAIGPLRPEGRSLARNIARYKYVMGRLGITRADAGVTGHGLRAQWVLEWFERRGHVPAVRVANDAPRAPTLSALDQAVFDADRKAVALQLGHGRASVIDAYAGPARGARPASSNPDPSRVCPGT